MRFNYLKLPDARAAIDELAADVDLVTHTEIERDSEGRVNKVLVIRMGRVLHAEIRSTKTDPTGTVDTVPRAPTMPKGQE
jgi:hypothetical protein